MKITPLDDAEYSIRGGSVAGRLAFAEGSSVADLATYLREQPEALADAVASFGAVIVRGLGTGSVEDYERLWEGQARWRVWRGYAFMEASRAKLGASAVSSNFSRTMAERGGPLSFHQENHFLPRALSPDWLAFACLAAAEEGGETGLINVAAALAELGPRLRGKLEAAATVRTARLSSKMWASSFGDLGADALIARAEEFGVVVVKRRGEELVVRFERPYVVAHPRTGQMAVHYERQLLNRWPGAEYLGVFQPHHVAQVRRRVLPALSRRFARTVADLTGRLRISHLNLSDDEVDELYSAWARHCLAIPYRAGDVLLVDNVVMEHTGLAWRGARKRELAVFMGSHGALPSALAHQAPRAGRGA